jgi:ATP phosphoribosyltransferase regulatory subunit
LHTRSDGFAGTRSPLQIGAEIFGHSGAESDVEIIRLVMLTLERAGIEDTYLDLGHVGVYRGLAKQARLDQERENRLFDAMQRKSMPEIETLIGDCGVTGAPARMLLALADLNGEDALERADRLMRHADASVREALEHLRRVAEELTRWLPGTPVHFDLAELRGYHYKTGIVFAAFAPGWGQEVARGGRYDDIGQVFGRARPAVGFSTDLKGLLRLAGEHDDRSEHTPTVLAPWSSDPDLQEEIARLRGTGRRVLADLPGGGGSARDLGCEEVLVRDGGRWVLVPA